MLFSSMIFLCGFLPVVWIVYYLMSRRTGLANLWLFLASLFFYAWGEPRYIFIMLFSTVFDYCNGRLIGVFQKREKPLAAKLVLILSVVGNLGILGFFKYADFVIGSINSLTGSGFGLLSLALPIGISFYTFQTMSYTIDVYRGEVTPQRNIVNFGMYVCLFPQLIAGPIVRYRDVEKQITGRHIDWESAEAGLMRFLIGLAKKVLLANQVGEIYEMITGLSGELSTGLAWLGAICYTFQIYFDFSGYSDMAIGLGRMFGFHFPENFDHPYESRSVTEFWRRWHMTLSGWFRDYVYIPLGGNRKGLPRQIFHLLIVWFLTGLWHGAGWNFVIWGLYYFVFLVLEKAVLGKVLGRLPLVLQHLYTMFVVVIGWVLFAMDDFTQLKRYVQAMFGVGVRLTSDFTLYEWRSLAGFLLLLAIGATSIPARAAKRVCSEKCRKVLGRIVTILLLFLSVAFLVSGSYNPFLYFRF